MNKIKHYIIPVFIPELACPNQCVFCNQKKISGSINIPTEFDIISIIEKHLNTIDINNSFIEIAFFGGNFTGINIDLQEKYLKIANSFIKKNLIKQIRISTRPDYINQEKLDFLKYFNVKTIEIGAQSFDDKVLYITNRGHNSNDIINAANLINKNEFSLGLQMMIGLPGDTIEKSINTALKIIELKALNTRIYPALVIKDTKLEEMYLNKQYNPLSLIEAIDWTKKLFLIFEKNNVLIQRIGLHPSEGLLNGENLIAGPFHTSFKELVLSEIWSDSFNHLKNNENKSKSLNIFVNPYQLNYAIGYNSKNIKQLSDFYKKIYFKTDNKLNGRDFYVDIR